ncbi:MAG: PucR family transcriptional regulator [Solirubrobacterales bacterium]
MRIEEVRQGLTPRLIARLPEIKQAALTRTYSLGGPEVSDPEYVENLPKAVAAGIDYALAGVDRREERSPEIPAAVLTQGRLAARNGVSLDTVMRRCFACYALFGDYLVAEAEAVGLEGTPLQQLLRVEANRFDALVAGIAEEYARGLHRPADSVGARRVELVQRLLDGELLDTAELSYDLDAVHLGAIADGEGAEAALRALAHALGARLLLVQPDQSTSTWAWFGGRRRIDPERLQEAAATCWPERLVLAVGEPAQGPAGWRLSHQQARAALPIAVRRPPGLVRYADVALLASVLRDDLFTTSLQQLYLAPLSRERAGGETARETLRAYFAAGRNVSSAAAALGVSRQTAGSRLQAIEDRLGRTLDSCGAELAILLELESVGELA